MSTDGINGEITENIRLFVDDTMTLEEMCELEDEIGREGMALDWDDIIEVDGGMEVRMVPL